MSDIRACPRCKVNAYIHNMFDGKYRCTECGYIESDEEKAIETVRIKNGGLIAKIPVRGGYFERKRNAS